MDNGFLIWKRGEDTERLEFWESNMTLGILSNKIWQFAIEKKNFL